MPASANPALEKFIAAIEKELVLAQVLIRSTEGGACTLRHVADRSRAEAELRAVPYDQLRVLAQHTASGAFRPLKSAPTLPTGWTSAAASPGQLGTALNQLYPGAIADWFAALNDPPPVTNFREFTNRQSGMYRITQTLADDQAAGMIRAGCHTTFCLKRRLWSVSDLPPDRVGEKSLIPCLEPCAVLLEFARKAARIGQAEKIPLELAADEVATVTAALQDAAHRAGQNIREADFNAEENPRRIQWLLEKLQAAVPPGPVRGEEEH